MDFAEKKDNYDIKTAPFHSPLVNIHIKLKCAIIFHSKT